MASQSEYMVVLLTSSVVKCVFRAAFARRLSAATLSARLYLDAFVAGAVLAFEAAVRIMV
jgi:hypothetical protein